MENPKPDLPIHHEARRAGTKIGRPRRYDTSCGVLPSTAPIRLVPLPFNGATAFTSIIDTIFGGAARFIRYHPLPHCRTSSSRYHVTLPHRSACVPSPCHPFDLRPRPIGSTPIHTSIVSPACRACKSRAHYTTVHYTTLHYSILHYSVARHNGYQRYRWYPFTISDSQTESTLPRSVNILALSFVLYGNYIPCQPFIQYAIYPTYHPLNPVRLARATSTESFHDHSTTYKLSHIAGEFPGPGAGTQLMLLAFI